MRSNSTCHHVFFLCVCFCHIRLVLSHLAHIRTHKSTHKPDQTKIKINGFDMAKSAAQLLYGPVLVWVFVLYLYHFCVCLSYLSKHKIISTYKPKYPHTNLQNNMIRSDVAFCATDGRSHAFKTLKLNIYYCCLFVCLLAKDLFFFILNSLKRINQIKNFQMDFLLPNPCENFWSQT